MITFPFLEKKKKKITFLSNKKFWQLLLNLNLCSGVLQNLMYLPPVLWMGISQYGTFVQGSLLQPLLRHTTRMWMLFHGTGTVNSLVSSLSLFHFFFPIWLMQSYYVIRLASCMLASGCDDGTFSIRDLRLLKVSLMLVLDLK